MAAAASRGPASPPKLFAEAAPLLTMDLGEIFYAGVTMEDVANTVATLRRGLAPLRATQGDFERSPGHIITASRIRVPIHLLTG
eukprot:939260-Pyramimonas_sp.AAC.1